MAITKIKVSNFKSFKDLEIELGNFNVIVGANASGKSNFTQIFKFIRDITSLGLDNAISLQGSEFLINMGLGLPQSLSLEVTAIPSRLGFNVAESLIAWINKFVYQTTLYFGPKITDIEVKKDYIDLSVEFSRFQKTKNGKLRHEKPVGNGNIIIKNDKGTPKVQLKKPSGIKATAKNLFPPFFLREKIKLKSLILASPFFLFPPIETALSDIAIYDFDPKMSKKAVSVAGKSELEEDGSNLSLVLKSIVENQDKKRKLSNLIKDLLPFIDDLATDKFADRSLLFKLRENYFPSVYFPASFISDGTVNISALLCALYFEKKSVTIIEEPERNIHPSLISRMVDMMKDASKKKQIIVTTHNPEVVKYAGIENLLLISRDKEGFSTISRPKDNERVKTFMKNELGLDDLYVQNLLED